MKIIRVGDLQGRAIDEHRSTRAQVLHLAGASEISSIVRIQLGPRGVLGMHEAAEDQLFLVTRGSGEVRTSDTEPVTVVEGDAVIWRGGELHETRSGPEGLSAVAIEGELLGDSLQVE